MNSAIRSRRDWHSGNTRVEITEDQTAIVYLHGNKIAEVDETNVRLFDGGGYQTVTTKSRLNALLEEVKYGCRVFQKNFDWFVKYNDEVASFWDGMILIDADSLQIA